MLARIAARGDDGVWIASLPRDRLLADARKAGATARRRRALPLYGVPFAVKDNIDVAGLPTTAACPAFAYTPSAHAPVVARLLAAGAHLRRQDQPRSVRHRPGRRALALRRPAQPVRRALHRRRLQLRARRSAVAAGPGQLRARHRHGRARAACRRPSTTSSGSSRARGLLTATRRRPGLPLARLRVGLRAHRRGRGRASPTWRAATTSSDPFARPDADAIRFAPGPRPPALPLRRPGDEALDFLGDARRRRALRRSRPTPGGPRWHARRHRLRARSGAPAALLYDGPFVAERLVTAARMLRRARPRRSCRRCGRILEAATRIDARAVFEAQHRLRPCAGARRAVLAGVDFLLVPTTPTIYRIDEVEAEPLRLNAPLGDLRELRQPARPRGARRAGRASAPTALPAGVTLIGPAGSDAALAALRVGASPRDVDDARRDRRQPLPTRARLRPRAVTGGGRSRSPWWARTSRASRSTTS